MFKWLNYSHVFYKIMELQFVFVYNFKFKCMFVAFFKTVGVEKTSDAFIA